MSHFFTKQHQAAVAVLPEPSALAEGQLLKIDDSGNVVGVDPGASLSILGIDDSSLGVTEAGQALTWNGTGWAFSHGSGATELNELADVTIGVELSDTHNGWVLAWDNTTGKFIAAAQSGSWWAMRALESWPESASSTWPSPASR